MATAPFITDADAATIECDILNGVSPGMTLRTRVWEVPGFDGYGAQTLGLGGGRFELVATKFGQETAVETWLTSMEAIAGTVVSITRRDYDDGGDNTDANMLIESVEKFGKRRVATVVGPASSSAFDTVASVRLRGVRDKVP